MTPILYAATINPLLPTIDLHGERFVTDAMEQLEREAFRISQERNTACRIIYGLGEGTMRKAVLDVIIKNPMFGEYIEEDSGGSLVVLL